MSKTIMTSDEQLAAYAEQQEPVAWLRDDGLHISHSRHETHMARDNWAQGFDTPVYATPVVQLQQEPVAWVPKFSWQRSIDATACKSKRSFDDIPLYPANQLAQVVQQRDELLAALKCAESLFDRKWNSVVGSGCEFHWQPVGNWRHYTCKMTGETFIEAIAKVQP